MLTDLPTLQRRLSELRQPLGNGPEDGERIEALVECAFRTAVHPGTEGSEALDLLTECVRIDGTHPRYAYHLARVYFEHGELDLARKWIERAARQCPTSHRIWSHVCLLHWELNLRYHGDKRYEPDALRKRGDAIATSIRAGADILPPHLLDFHPPESLAEKEKRDRLGRRGPGEDCDSGATRGLVAGKPIRRLAHPATCRWSGIHDLLVERMVEGRPGTKRLEESRPLLERIAALCSARPGGGAAFAITAIQWIVSGYPVSTVRRLADGLVLDCPTPPSLTLLDLVCRLFEARIEDVPGLLGSALEAGRIPPALAAIVHRRRVLWRPLEYSALVAYRDARKLLSHRRRSLREEAGSTGDPDDEVRSLLQKLVSALDSMDTGPPLPLEEPEGPDTGASSPDGLAALEEWSQRQSESLDGFWSRLKGLATAAKKGKPGSREEEEIRAIQEAVEGIFSGADDRLKATDALRESGAMTQEERGLERLDATQKQYQTMLSRRGPFRSKFAAAGGAAPPPSVERGPSETPRPENRIESSGLAGLAQAVALTDKRVTELFRQALATFDSYSPVVMAEPPMRAARQSVRAQQAETLHRMGKRTEARRVLVGMMREDRVDPDTLKRLALSYSSDQDTGQTTGAWRSYAEILYFLDVVEKSPRPRAPARRELHRALGGGYAPSFFAEKLDQNWQQSVDSRAMSSFLSSPGRVRNFVGHKLLEFLNAVLEYRSPLLRLGVTREEGEEARQEAAAAYRTFLEEVRDLIPARVRPAFSSLVATHFDQAVEMCKEPRLLLQKKDVHYAEDRDRHLKVLADLVQLKYKLFASAGQGGESEVEISSVGVFAELARLDRIPMNLSREMATAAAGSVGGMTGEVAQRLMEKLLESAMGRLLDQLFSEPDGDEECRLRQYRLLLEDLGRYPALDRYRSILDDPQSKYPDTVLRCLQAQPVHFTDDAVQALEDLHSRFPQVSGVSRLLAHAYSAREEREAAIHVLEQGTDIGLSPEGRERCSRQMRNLSFQKSIEEEEYAKAAKLGLELLAEDDETPTLAQNVIVISANAAQGGTDGPSPSELESAVEAWLGRARKNPACTEESIRDVVRTLESSLLQMLVARVGGPGKSKDWQKVLQALEVFEGDHPGVLDICFYRMTAHFQLGAGATHDPSGRQAALNHFRSAKADAERLAADANASPSQREQATHVLGQIARIL